MVSTLPSARVLLAWKDTTGETEIAVHSLGDGRTLALDRHTRDALAGAAGVLPWLAESSHHAAPMCGYAVIAEDTSWIRSGFALHPNADDIERLNREFVTISSALRTRSAPSVRLSLCGGTATVDDRDVSLSDREFSVIATLAVARRPLGREELCDALWPERDLDASLRLLKVYVHRIRARFGTATVIETRHGGYQLGEAVGVDVHEADAIVRAADASSWLLEPAQRLVLQRALDGVSSRGYRRLEALEAFGEIERRFLSAAAAAARTLVDDALADHEGSRAVAFAEQLLALDPSDEDAAELLIRTLLRLGRRDAAERSFRAICRTLRDELDATPSAHLAALLET